MEEIRFEYHPTCTLCGHGIERKRINVNFKSNILNIYKCLKCQVHFTNPAVVEEDIPKLYRRHEKKSIAIGKDQGFVYLVRRLRHYFYFKKVAYKDKRNNLTILDFGCGDGIFALYLATNKKIKNVVASDFFIESPIALKNRKLYVTNEDIFVKYKNSFDYIFLRHVLEHTSDPVNFIRKMSSLLNVDGKIIAEVPNYACVWRKIFSSYFGMLSMPYHFFHFTKTALRNIFGRDYKLQFKVARVPVLYHSISGMFGVEDNGFSAISIAFIPLQVAVEIIFNSPTALLVIIQRKDV